MMHLPSLNTNDLSRYKEDNNMNEFLQLENSLLNKYVAISAQKYKLDGNICSEKEHLQLLNARNSKGEFSKIIREDGFIEFYKFYRDLPIEDKAKIINNPTKLISEKIEQRRGAELIEGVIAFSASNRGKLPEKKVSEKPQLQDPLNKKALPPRLKALSRSLSDKGI